MTTHQSFHSVTTTNHHTTVTLNTFDLAASLATASAVADREGMHGIAQRLMADAVFLRSHSHDRALVVFTHTKETDR